MRGPLIERNDPMSDPVKMWTLYSSPDDYPGLFVVREFLVEDGRPSPGRVLAITKNINIARASIRPDAVCVGRDPGDDLAIVETWE